MTPNYEAAARAATETLIKFNITAAPVDPLAIIKKIPGVVLLSYQKVSNHIGVDRRCVMSMFGEENQDALTFVNNKDGQHQYIVTYNQLLSYGLIQKAIARELGHIVLGHDGSRPEDVRNEEAICFAHHLLCPRPLIHAIQATGIRLTFEVFGNITGCYDSCVSCVRKFPAVHVPADLNRQVRKQFMPYVMNFFEYQRIAANNDGSALADLGNFMDGYEE